MRPNRIALVLSGLAVAVLTGGAAGTATAAPASCRIDTSTTEESPEWLSSPIGQRVVEALAAELDRPADPSAKTAKPDGLDSLRTGIIGRTVDHRTQEIVVVIDPDRHDRIALGRDLSRVVDRARGATGPKVRV